MYQKDSEGVMRRGSQLPEVVSVRYASMLILNGYYNSTILLTDRWPLFYVIIL